MDSTNEPDPTLLFEQIRARLSYLQFRDLYEKNKKEIIEITEDILLAVKGDYRRYQVVVTILEKGKPDKTVNVPMLNFYASYDVPDPRQDYRPR